MSNYYYLGSYASNGVPNYLTSTESIDPALIRRIRASLPEKQPVPTFNPSYLTNTAPRNVIISTINPLFDGADVYVTFLDEGAGYKNTLGYYTYDIRTPYTCPTKGTTVLGVTTYSPMSSSDVNTLGSDNKYSLKQTIIFPNCSLSGSGGGMVPGMKVKLLYDPSDPTIKFPNNTGIGFFVIPNGYGTNSVTNANTKLFSDKELNPGQYVQSIIFYDSVNSTSNQDELIVGIEDISRSLGGDNDFNDLIFKVSYTPSYINNTSSSLILSTGSTITVTDLIADKTGLYLQLPTNTVNSLLNVSASVVGIKQKIKCRNAAYCSWVKAIYDVLIHEMGGVVSYDTDVDANNNPTSLKICYSYNKGDIKSYMYLMKSINNKTQTSPIDPSYRNIVSYQDLYIYDTDDIIEETWTFYDNSNTSSIYLTQALRPNTTYMLTPLAMGDPHIMTVSGYKYEILNDKGAIQLYGDNQYEIVFELDSYPENIGTCYDDLTFMKNLLVLNKQSKDEIVFDLFEPSNVYKRSNNSLIDTNLPEFIKLIQEDKYNDNIKNRIKNYQKLLDKFQIKYYKIKSDKFDEIIIEQLFVFHIKDYINSVSLIINPMLLDDEITGAIICQNKYKKFNNLFEIL